MTASSQPTDRRSRRAATRPSRRFSTRHPRCSDAFRSSRSPPAGLPQQAGISVGALYRFYSDRQEIFDAIAVRELDAFRAEIERAFTARQLIFSPRKSLGRVLDAYVDFLESRPHFRELSLGNHISDWTRESQSDPADRPGRDSGRPAGEEVRLEAGQETAIEDPHRGRGGRPRDCLRLQAGVAGGAARCAEGVEGNADAVSASIIRLLYLIF